MKKIIPALALLLISAVVMSTASFAWFSMNATVSATGMSVKAVTGGDLQISTTNVDGNYGTTVSLADSTVKTLNPASTVGLASGASAPVFYSLTSGKDMSANSFAAGTDSTFGVTTTDYLMKTVYVRYAADDTAAKSLTVSNLQLTNTAQNLDAAARVMFVVYSAEPTATGGAAATPQASFIYAPNAKDAEYGTFGTNPAGAISTISGATSGTVTATGVVNLCEAGTASTATSILTMTPQTAYKIEIYMWYEGQDVACATNNAVNVNQAVVEIGFTAN